VGPDNLIKAAQTVRRDHILFQLPGLGRAGDAALRVRERSYGALGSLSFENGNERCTILLSTEAKDTPRWRLPSGLAPAVETMHAIAWDGTNLWMLSPPTAGHPATTPAERHGELVIFQADSEVPVRIPILLENARVAGALRQGARLLPGKTGLLLLQLEPRIVPREFPEFAGAYLIPYDALRKWVKERKGAGFSEHPQPGAVERLAPAEGRQERLNAKGSKS